MTVKFYFGPADWPRDNTWSNRGTANIGRVAGSDRSLSPRLLSGNKDVSRILDSYGLWLAPGPRMCTDYKRTGNEWCTRKYVYDVSILYQSDCRNWPLGDRWKCLSSVGAVWMQYEELFSTACIILFYFLPSRFSWETGWRRFYVSSVTSPLLWAWDNVSASVSYRIGVIAIKMSSEMSEISFPLLSRWEWNGHLDQWKWFETSNLSSVPWCPWRTENVTVLLTDIIAYVLVMYDLEQGTGKSSHLVTTIISRGWSLENLKWSPSWNYGLRVSSWESQMLQALLLATLRCCNLLLLSVAMPLQCSPNNPRSNCCAVPLPCFSSRINACT